MKRITGGALAGVFAMVLAAPALAGGGGCWGTKGDYDPKATSLDKQIDSKTLTDTSQERVPGQEKKI